MSASSCQIQERRFYRAPQSPVGGGTDLHAVWCPFPSWNNDLTALCRCQPLLSFKRIRTRFLPSAKTADVTLQPGRSGSSSPRAPDRPAEPHDGWALSISRLHLWPAPDYSWRLLYSPLGSALHAPLTLHSERAAGIKPSQHQRENHSWSWGVRERWGAERDIFFSPGLFFILSADMTPLKDVVCPTRHSQACIIAITLTFNTPFLETSNRDPERRIHHT